jgi:hypothetical protein
MLRKVRTHIPDCTASYLLLFLLGCPQTLTLARVYGVECVMVIEAWIWKEVAYLTWGY